MRKKQKSILQNLLIENYAAEGKSLGRVAGKVIFVEDVVPGDVVDVRLTKEKKDWGSGIPINFQKLSADRVTPFCEHFGVCGGCQWQMLPYGKQLEYKQQQVADHLERIGKVALPTFEPIAGAYPHTHYRNKLEYTFSNKRYLLPEELNNPAVTPQTNVAGFHARGLFDKVVDIRNCHLQPEPTNAIRLAIKRFALENNFSFYDIREHRGFMRTLQLRICRTGETMVNIVFGEDDAEKRNALLDFMRAEHPSVTTLLYTINLKKNDSLFDLDPVVVWGKGFVIERLGDFQFKIGPKSFFQTNTWQAEKLYEIARDFAELRGSETVYDLYCGTGSIGIFLSGNAKKIIGVETIPEAIADAKENAALNGVAHAQFFCGDVATVCTDDFFDVNGRPDVIVTDPPRAGMSDTLVKQLLRMEAQRIVYVSCNAATQARDLNILQEKYEVARVRPVDMFPHTHHIENVVQLRLKTAANT